MTDVNLGNHVILNRGNQIGHDTKISDFFTALPGSIVSGGVTIGERVLLGTSALTLEKLILCDDVIVGANACLTKNADQAGRYVGTPAKLID
jgi:UDP-3-O-[3-hydroxymyristoyl] glucosamine N-acyltransferase